MSSIEALARKLIGICARRHRTIESLTLSHGHVAKICPLHSNLMVHYIDNRRGVPKLSSNAKKATYIAYTNHIPWPSALKIMLKCWPIYDMLTKYIIPFYIDVKDVLFFL